MLGLATRLIIAERVLDVLSGVDPELAQLLSKNKQRCMVGAPGPTIGDFVPNTVLLSPDLGGAARSPYALVSKQILKVAVGDSMENLQSVVPTLRTLTNALISCAKYDHGHGR